jgi:hypothetical protein
VDASELMARELLEKNQQLQAAIATLEASGASLKQENSRLSEKLEEVRGFFFRFFLFFFAVYFYLLNSRPRFI